MKSKSFKTSLKKGDIGERVVIPILERKGFTVYRPFTEGAHCFDILAIQNKDKAIALDVKAKARLNRYEATGIDQRHFEEYRNFSEKHNMDFWVIFVDEMLGEVYGNKLTELEKPRCKSGEISELNKTYPMVKPWGDYGSDIRVWHLNSMIRNMGTINDEAVIDLKNYSQRTHDYLSA